MDVVLIGYFIPTLLWFIPSIIVWRWTLAEKNQGSRTKKLVLVFLMWFIPNWSLIMMALFSPVWYEPSPVVPGLIALQITLPLFLILSIPFVISLLNQLRKPRI